MGILPSRVPAGRSGKRSPVDHFLHDRSLRLACALAVAIAIPVAVLFYFQFRSLSDLSRSSAIVLQQLSEETADDISHTIADALKAPYLNVLLRINQRLTEPLDLPLIEATFERSLSADAFIDGYYVWSEVADEHRGEVLAYDRSGEGFLTDVPEARMLVERFHELGTNKRTINGFETDINGRRTYILGHLRFQSPVRDHVTSFVALRVDAERLRTVYFPTLIAARLKNVQGPTGFPPLVVTLQDEAGRVVFPTDGRAAKGFVEQRAFPLVFFDPELVEVTAPVDMRHEIWRLHTGYGDQTIPAIIAARARPQRLLMAALAGIMAFGVFFVARAAAREVRLAELKSNFVSSVSHDLKTPLALIQLFAETLELGRLKNTDRTQEYYRIINSEARKLTRLINNLLDFSRIEAGLRRYKLEPTDLGAVAKHVLDSLESQFRQNQFAVTLRVTPDLPPTLLDQEAAEQALENLLSNAMKYSPASRDILVEVDQRDGYGCISVTDHGVGIPPRLQQKIFRKFYRVQSDAGSGPQGCGLGLAIVDHVMRAHGGFVRVNSELGQGTTFTLNFRLYVGEEHSGEADSRHRRRTADVARSA